MKKNREQSRHDAGFTLIELLVVLVILGLLAAIAGPQVLKYVSSAKSDTAKMQIERLSGILDLYRLETGRYPTQEQGLKALVEAPAGQPAWNGPYLKQADALVDPWGKPYVYRAPGRKGDFDLYTLGADGREGGDGENRDVVNW
jgi:general secretion pathway protein G